MRSTVVNLGAGPAGLQLGYFLRRASADYVTLDRGCWSGVILSS
jgi:protoporphyrinogen oxidase